MSKRDEVRIARPSEHKVEVAPWGRIVWIVSGELGNSTSQTLGRCFLHPGQANDRHLHPECDELLEVLSGSIVHTWAEEEVPMERGDVISIPAGVVHNARNTGDTEAELLIVFSSSRRSTVLEAPGGAVFEESP